MATKTKPDVIQFRTQPMFEDEDELPVGLPPVAPPQLSVVRSDAGIDLAKRAKVWFAIGPGRSGKTMLLRWAAEMSANQGGTPIVAAADPQNRSLKNYLDNVAEPPTNDATASSRWLEALLRHLMDEKTSALVDLGGVPPQAARHGSGPRRGAGRGRRGAGCRLHPRASGIRDGEPVLICAES